jgi:hypothetical protein
MADQEGARGNPTPTVGTDEPANDSYRSHSPDNDGLCAVGHVTSGQWGEDHSGEPNSGPGPHVLGVTAPCRFCGEAHSWVDCPTPHTLCFEGPSDYWVPRWHPFRGLYCGVPLYVFNEDSEAISFAFGGTKP